MANRSLQKQRIGVFESKLLKENPYGSSTGSVSKSFPQVLIAVGRNACTDKIGLDKVGVKVNPK